MDSALTRFFELPELIILLASCLSTRDLSCLMQTCKQVNISCRPTFYYSVDLVHTHENFVQDLSGLKGIARNAEWIHSLQIDTRSGRFYHAALQEVLQERRTNFGFTNNGTISNANHWILPSDTPSASLTSNYSSATHTQYQASVNYIILQLGPLLRQSPRLSELHLFRLKIGQDIRISRLATAISEIITLRKLFLSFFPVGQPPSDFASPIFFSCPPSLETLSIEMLLDIIPDPFGFVRIPREESITRRQKPLYRLTDLIMDLDWGFSITDILAILEHCPRLDSMCVPEILDIHLSEQVATTITTICPNLRSLLLLYNASSNAEVLALKIFEKLPRNTIIYFNYVLYREDDMNSFSTTLGRHFESLRSVKLEDCIWIKPAQIQGILSKCPVLQVFIFTEASDHQLDITVSDLVANKWASTKLVELALVTSYSLYNAPRCRNYADLTVEDKEQVLMLKRLYHQIGIQSSLRYLRLSVLVSADDLDQESNPLSTRDYAFPGLLSKGDDDNEGRWGCLRELAGLENLEVIRTSLNPEAVMDVGYTYEQRDVDLISAHWHKLRSIEAPLRIIVLYWTKRGCIPIYAGCVVGYLMWTSELFGIVYPMSV